MLHKDSYFSFGLDFITLHQHTSLVSYATTMVTKSTNDVGQRGYLTSRFREESISRNFIFAVLMGKYEEKALNFDISILDKLEQTMCEIFAN